MPAFLHGRVIRADHEGDLENLVRDLMEKGYVPSGKLRGTNSTRPYCNHRDKEFFNIFNQPMTKLHPGQTSDLVDYCIFFVDYRYIGIGVLGTPVPITINYENHPSHNGMQFYNFTCEEGWSILPGKVIEGGFSTKTYYACVKHRHPEFDPAILAEGDKLIDNLTGVRVRFHIHGTKCLHRDDRTETWSYFDSSKNSFGIILHNSGGFTVFERREHYVRKKTYMSEQNSYEEW